MEIFLNSFIQGLGIGVGFTTVMLVIATISFFAKQSKERKFKERVEKSMVDWLATKAKEEASKN